MLVHVLILLLSFALILLGSEMFTNGVEWVGHHLQIAEAAVGSLLAAVGTALPETFIPAVALLTGSHDLGARSAVGIGAILGAPLMLSTVALFVMGMAGIAFRRRRNRVALTVPQDDVRRDLSFFLPTFLILVLLGLGEPARLERYVIAFLLLALYCTYGVLMLRMRRASDIELEHGLYFEAIFGGNPLEPRLFMAVAQVFVGVLAILLGATEFVEQIILFSRHVGLNPGVLSLILSPLATELPEKYNSVVWIRQRKDNLALANITGAMVFQSCIPAALGIAFTPWHLSHAELLAGAIGLISASLLYYNVRKGELRTATLMLGGAAYVIFIAGLAVMGLF